MPSLAQTLSNPAYAAIIAALVTLVAKYVDHRIAKKPDYLTDYLKSMAWCSALSFFIVYTITNPRAMTRRVGTIMNEPF